MRRVESHMEHLLGWDAGPAVCSSEADARAIAEVPNMVDLLRSILLVEDEEEMAWKFYQIRNILARIDGDSN